MPVCVLGAGRLMEGGNVLGIDREADAASRTTTVRMQRTALILTELHTCTLVDTVGGGRPPPAALPHAYS